MRHCSRRSSAFIALTSEDRLTWCQLRGILKWMFARRAADTSAYGDGAHPDMLTAKSSAHPQARRLAT